MTLEKALKSVKASNSKLLLKLGPYCFDYQNGEFFDMKNKKANLTMEEKNSTEWEIKCK